MDRTPETGGSDQLGENYLRSLDLELDPTGRERKRERKKRKHEEKGKWMSRWDGTRRK